MIPPGPTTRQIVHRPTPQPVPGHRQTVAEYLEAWLEVKQRSLKPTTMARYLDYVHKDLVPAVGAIRL
ncbi:MAG: hypothetical protein AB7H43_15505, partial [Acidimicrobiia bacterium]